MNTEYEATFFDINEKEIKDKIKELGGKIFLPETLMKIKTFRLPKEIEKNNGYVRIRDEGYRITMALKMYIGKGIESEKESEVEVKSFDNAFEFVKNLGMVQKAEQEKKREIWILDGVEIMFDEWPFLETYVEVEGKNEEEVRKVSEKIGFDWKKAHFGGSIAKKVSDKYGISEKDINDNISKITFDENPFEKFLRENKK